MSNYKESLSYDPAHQIISKIIFPPGDSDLKTIRPFLIANDLGVPPATFWRYCSGEARWPAGVWLLTMAYLKSMGRPVEWDEVFNIYLQILKETPRHASVQDIAASSSTSTDVAG